MSGADSRSALGAAIFAAVAGELADGLTVLGICGSQASGKSTAARAIAALCAERGIAVATLSLDDLYLTRAARQRLARDVHPLLATRGVPGTHDVALGLATLAALARGEAAVLPRFSKAADDRLPLAEWDRAPPDCRLLVFEGWCVGARPQRAAALAAPINALEAEQDRAGIWRRYANDALAGDYQRLFARVDRLALLAAPSFDTVLAWRLRQEDELRAHAAPDAPGVMDPAGVRRFVQFYERLTRHILKEMPERADLVIRLDHDHTPLGA